MIRYRFTEPIVMPRGKHYGNNYYIFKSRKVGRTVTAYSTLEYENLITLEMNPEVEFFCEQPLKVSVIEDGITYETVFDVWVLYRDGREEFQEVKYSSDANNSDPNSRTARQIRLQKQWCSLNNENHVVRTEKDIYLGQYYIMNLENMAAKVRRYRIPADVQKTMERDVVNLLEERYLTLGDICSSGLLPAGMETEILSMMYYKGLIGFSNIADTIINEKTEVILNG